MPAATKRVGGTVSNLTATRETDEVNGHRVDKVKVEWKNPAYLFDENRADHATWLDSNIDFMVEGRTPTSGQVWADAGTLPPSGGRLLEYTGFDYNWVKGINQTTSYEKPFDRNRFHPVAKGKYCKSIQIKMHGGNDSGVGGWDPDDRQASGRGPDAMFTYNFEQPDRTDEQWVGINEDNNYALDYKIARRYFNPKADDDKTPCEIYDTVFTIYRQDNIPNSGYSKRKVFRTTDAIPNDGEEFTNSLTIDRAFLSIGYNQWLRFTIEAYNRGIWGDGPKSESVFLYAWPQRAVITGISLSSTSNTTGIITVRCKTPYDENKRTTRAKLQRLKNADPDLTADEVMSDDYDWTDVTGMVEIDEENQEATWSNGFVDSVASARPSGPNKRTWYRVVTENDIFYGDNCVKSRPFECVQLYREQTATDDVVFIESLDTNEDATAIKMLLGWRNSVDSTGIEVSWSEHEDAWESSEQPNTAEVTWEDATNQGSHDKSAHFTIYGVEQGQKVYIKARWYFEQDGEISNYGSYATAQSDNFPFIPATPPTDVRLSAPAFAPKGSDVGLTWTFQADAPQTAWVVYLVDGNNRTAVASGDDAYGACTVPSSMLPTDEATLVVAMTTGSSWAESEPQTIRFADAPTIGAVVPSTGTDDELPIILAQPLSVYCSSDTGDDYLRVRVVSRGITVQKPDGAVYQLPGDVVFDAYVAPEWGEASDGYYTVVSLPTGLEIYDVGLYDIEVTGVNQVTGLKSDTQTTTARVRWYHQAHQPGDASTVTAYPDDRVCVITPAAPDNAADTDVFDLYRVTPDGAYLIASDLPFGSSVSDRYAPFGRGPLLYRICTRTSDGDISWRDVEYEMKCVKLRFDWGEQHLELPYNLVRNESWAKDFERRKHLDGNVGGGWNPAVDHDGSISTDLVRFESSEEQALVRNLANHAGPVFVRLPNGLASQANVDVNSFDESYQSGALAASFSANFISLTDEFKVATSEISYVEVQEQEALDKMAIGYWGETQPKRNDTFTLTETPTSIRVKLSTSYDRYTNEWTVPATFSGTTVTLGTFSSELQAYLQEAAGEGTLYLVRCEYA